MSELIDPFAEDNKPLVPKKENKIATFFINLIGTVVSFVLSKIIKQFFDKPEKNPLAYIILISIGITGIVYHIIWAIKYWPVTLGIVVVVNITMGIMKYIKSKKQK